MKDGEQLSKQQIELKPLTVGKLKQILAKSELPDDAKIFADYPNGWSGIFQVYKQDGDLYLLASDWLTVAYYLEQNNVITLRNTAEAKDRVNQYLDSIP